MADGKKNWTPPTDMPAEQLESCLSGKMCGARLKNPTTHRYCRQRPMPGQVTGFPHRCRRHGGGASPPDGNKNALRHGIYSRALLDGEEELYSQVAVGNLEHEIRITKIRLRRALLSEREQSLRIASEDAKEREKCLQLDSVTRQINDGDSKVSGLRVERKVVDYQAVIHNLVSQVVKLEMQQSLLGGGSVGAEDKARIARETLARMNAELDADDGAEEHSDAGAAEGAAHAD